MHKGTRSEVSKQEVEGLLSCERNLMHMYSELSKYHNSKVIILLLASKMDKTTVRLPHRTVVTPNHYLGC